MNIVLIDETSVHLPRVKELWRRNSRTLGFFPEGAFEDHAAKRSILIAEGAGEFLGYLLYRAVRRGSVWPRAIVVHLCIQEDCRGKGISRALVEGLREITKDRFLQIELKCRRDYEATELWPRFGFTYTGEEIGRAGSPIAHWIMPLRQLPLMALLNEVQSQSGFRAVIDANVLYRLQDTIPSSPADAKVLSEEAKALHESWLSDDVLLLVTDESFNEIQRNENPTERSRRLRYAKQYQRVVCQSQEVQIAWQSLSPLFPRKPGINTESDIRQVANAIAANADCFITQDRGLLRKSEEIYHKFGIKLMSPGQFIGQVDEVIREAQYRPEYLAGVRNLVKSRLQSSQLPSLHPHFRLNEPSERRTQFEQVLRAFMAQPETYDIQLYSNSNDNPLALIVHDKSSSQELKVPMIRIVRSRLEGTVFRYQLHQAIDTAIKENRMIVRINAKDLPMDLSEALRELGFSNVEENWLKCNLPFIGNSSELIVRLSQIRSMLPQLATLVDSTIVAINDAFSNRDVIAFADIERRLWPAKILDSGIPNYIIPIKPHWAQHLFDPEMAKQTLWGARDDLALRHENVYYRSKYSAWQITSPSRILWYVTDDQGFGGSKMIRACSFLDEVVVGRAKDLFNRFRRLGVYEWKEVLRTAKDVPNGHIMALRFSNTELLSNPIKLKTMSEIMHREENRAPFLQAPMLISIGSFAQLYRSANGPLGDNL